MHKYKLGIGVRLLLLLVLVMPIGIIYLNWDVMAVRAKIEAIFATFLLYWACGTYLRFKTGLRDFKYTLIAGAFFAVVGAVVFLA